MTRTAVFPGSFDPVSLGHIDIIERAGEVCDRLIIAIGYNAAKPSGLFSVDERLEMLRRCTAHLDFVEVQSFTGMVIDFARSVDANYLLRGVRAFSDFEYEFRMALANRTMSGIETIFLMTASKHAHVSSTLIRDIGQYGRGLDSFVPEKIREQVYERLACK